MKRGPLDRRVSILRKTIELSISGAEVEVWHPLGVLARWASITPLKGDERFSVDQRVSTEQVEVRMRWSQELASLTPLDRIVSPALKLAELDGSPPDLVPDDEIADRRQYDVLAVHEIGRREGLLILASRRADGPTILEPVT